MSSLKIAIIANTTWDLYNFRLTLTQSLMAARHEVVAIGPPGEIGPNRAELINSVADKRSEDAWQ